VIGNNEVRDISKKLEIRDRDIQIQEEESRINNARYNARYKEGGIDRIGLKPTYLNRNSLAKRRDGTGVRALVRLRCGNMEENNRYWLEEKRRVVCFAGKVRMS